MDVQNKKRKIEEGINNTPNKKPATLPATDTRQAQEKHEVIVLQEQNKNLQLKIRELRREIEGLNQQGHNFQIKLEARDAILAQVNDVWSNLCEDLELSLLRIDSSKISTNFCDKAAKDQLDDKCKTFLERLLQLDEQKYGHFLTQIKPLYNNNTANNELPNISKLLEIRADFTRAILEKIIRAIKREKLVNEEIMHRITEDKDPLKKKETVLNTLQEENNKLREEMHAVEEKISQLHLSQREMQNSIEKYKNELTSSKQKIQDITDELELTKGDLTDAHKKIEKLKYQQDEANASAHQISANSYAIPSVVHGSGGSDEVIELRTHLQHAQTVLQGRLEEIEHHRKDKLGLECQISKLKADLLSEERICASITYQQLQQAYRGLCEELIQAQQMVDKLRKDLDMEAAARKADREKTEDEEVKKRKILEVELHNKDVTIARLTSEKDSIEFQLKQKQVTSENPTTVSEMKMLIESLQRDLQKLKTKQSSTSEQQKTESVTASGDFSNDQEKMTYLEKRVSELQAQLDSQIAEGEAMINELDSISKAYEDTQEQNTRLLEQLAQKDDAAAKLLSETIKAQQAARLAQDEREGLEQRIKASDDLRTAVLDNLKKAESRIKELQIQHAKCTEELRLATQLVETQKRIVGKHVEESEALKTKTANHKAALDEITKMHSEAIANLSEEKEKCLRLSEEVGGLRSQLERSKNAGNQEQEMDRLMNLLKCSVCKTERKNCVIARCFHTFCKGCIQQNLAVRNRKCPACGDKFGENDVHDLYL